MVCARTAVRRSMDLLADVLQIVGEAGPFLGHQRVAQLLEHPTQPPAGQLDVPVPFADQVVCQGANLLTARRGNPGPILDRLSCAVGRPGEFRQPVELQLQVGGSG